MPIKIPADLPARTTLEHERIQLIDQDRALHQDIRPLQIAILNLMPDKISTETQILRAIGTSPIQLEITLLRIASHQSKNTSQAHLEAFYKTLDDVKERRFDGLIVTGAPVEHLPFEQVNYWSEICHIFDWARSHVHSSMFICWGAQAALHHYYGVPKHDITQKRFGVFQHKLTDNFHPLIAGFDDIFPVPVSRHTEILGLDIGKMPELDILAESQDSGLCLVCAQNRREVFMFNHLEYDPETLAREYFRDNQQDADTPLPCDYFPDNDPQKAPQITWRAHRTLFFCNWINMVYQDTPYDLNKIA